MMWVTVLEEQMFQPDLFSGTKLEPSLSFPHYSSLNSSPHPGSPQSQRTDPPLPCPDSHQ